VLYLCLELGWNSWTLAFTVGMGQKPRSRTLVGRSEIQLFCEINQAKRRFGLPEQTRVISC
jgi:hypothetical protein